jgi:hypothetical protein
MSVQRCVALAAIGRYPVIGLQGLHCFAGDSMAAAQAYGKLPDAACSTPCFGNRRQWCGFVGSGANITAARSSMYSVTYADWSK